MTTILVAIVVPSVLALMALDAGYHIALRSGQFRRAKLRFTLSGVELTELQRQPPWLLLIGIPPTTQGHVCVTVPYQLRNEGEVALRNVWLQSSYPSALDIGAAAEAHFTDPAAGVSKTTKRLWPGRIFVEYNISVLRPGDKTILFDPIMYTNSDIPQPEALQNLIERSEHDAEARDRLLSCNPAKVDVHVRAENCRPIHHTFWLAVVRSPSLKHLQEILPELALSTILRLEGPHMTRWIVWVIRWLFRLPYAKRPVLLAQPRMHAGSAPTGFRASFETIGRTVYQPGFVARVLLKPPWVT